MILLLALLVLGTVSTAQVPARDQPPTPRAGPGVIRERVMRADTRDPLRRVQVRVDEWSTGDQATTVSGAVLDDRGGVALDGTVIVFADDPGKWGPQSRFIGSARPDQQGRFSIRGLPPGRYVAIAVGYLQPGEERDPDALETWTERHLRQSS